VLLSGRLLAEISFMIQAPGVRNKNAVLSSVVVLNVVAPSWKVATKHHKKCLELHQSMKAKVWLVWHIGKTFLRSRVRICNRDCKRENGLKINIIHHNPC
jgi:hypothetical protein